MLARMALHVALQASLSTCSSKQIAGLVESEGSGFRVRQVKEPSLASLARGKPVYEPPRYMTVAQAIAQLLQIERERGEGAVTPSTLCVGLARLGADTQTIVAGSLSQVAGMDLGPPLHSLVIPGDLHEVEQDFLSQFMIGDEQPAT